jgi:cytochrome c556
VILTDEAAMVAECRGVAVKRGNLTGSRFNKLAAPAAGLTRGSTIERLPPWLGSAYTVFAPLPKLFYPIDNKETKMRNKKLIGIAAAATVATLAASLPGHAHLDDKEFPQSYRQSYFALLAANFGPIASMVKGEMPWNDEQLKGYANDLAAVSQLNLVRGFPDGSDKGTTRAKPGIWDNRDDFATKLEDMQKAVAQLQQAAAGGDRKAVAEQVGATGNTCKACHDEYKSKEYLY